MTPGDGASAVPAGGGSSLLLPGGSGIMPVGTMTGARGVSLQAGMACGQARALSAMAREAWPAAAPWGWNTLLGKSRGGTPTGVLPPDRGSAASQDAAVASASAGVPPPSLS